MEDFRPLRPVLAGAVSGSVHSKGREGQSGGTRNPYVIPWRRGNEVETKMRELDHQYPARKYKFNPPQASRLRGFLQPGTKEWEEFFKTRKVIERVVDDESPVISVTRDVTTLQQSSEDKSRVGPVKSRRVKGKSGKKGDDGEVKRIYELAHLFVDAQLMVRFDVTQPIVNRIKAIAAVDVTRAAVMFQDHVRTFKGHESDEVIVGTYAQSWKLARDTVRCHAARFPEVSVTADALFCGDKVFIYGPAGMKGWRVLGPERVASLVRAVHTMVRASSPEVVAFALGPELTLLDIDVHDGTSIVCPTFRKHCGPHDDLPASSSVQITKVLSVMESTRLAQMARAVLPVELDGYPMASAVRISSQQILVSNHVFESAMEKTVESGKVYLDRKLSRDLWLANCPGESIAWSLRQPVVDEHVVVIYRRFSEVFLIGPMRIKAFTDDGLTYTKHKDLKAGMSGGAILALTDFSLLGVHDGVSLTNGVGARYTRSMQLMISERAAEDLEFDKAEQEDVEMSKRNPHKYFKEKGYGKIVASIYEAMSFDDLRHEGNLVLRGDGAAVINQAASDSVKRKVAEDLNATRILDAGRLTYYSIPSREKAVGGLVLREPIYGEAVAVLGKDSEGKFCSETASTISFQDMQRGSYRAKFTLAEASALTDGVFVALSDCAVLGMVVEVVDDVVVGSAIKFENLGDDLKIPLALSSIKEFLPDVVTRTWSKETKRLLTRLFSGKLEPQLLAIARLGSDWLRMRMGAQLFNKTIPSAQWDSYIDQMLSVETYRGRMRNLEFPRFSERIWALQALSSSELEDWRGGVAGLVCEVLIGMSTLHNSMCEVDELYSKLYKDC